MGKRNSDLENEVDDLTGNWVAVNRQQEPIAWQAWTNWRKQEMRTLIEPESLTVPTDFPPTTVSAAKAYFDVVRKIRRLNGWSDARSKLPSEPSAWMGEI